MTQAKPSQTGKQWTPQQLQAHRALIRASEKMGWNNYQAGLAAHVRKGRKANTYRYHPTEEHERVIKASSDVLKGKITPEQAMAMLHEYDIFNQRMGQAKKGRSHAKVEGSITMRLAAIKRAKTKGELVRNISDILTDDNLDLLDYNRANLKELARELKGDIATKDRSISLYYAKGRAVANVEFILKKKKGGK